MKKDVKKKKVTSSKVKKNEEKDILLICLSILLLIITIILIIVMLTNGKNLDTDSKQIKELYNYLSTEDLSQCDGLFAYSNKLVSAKDISKETKACLAYHKSDIKDSEVTEYKPDKKKNTCTIDGMTFKADDETNKCSVTKIERSIIDDTYKLLYNENTNGLETFKIDNYNICYLKDDNYYCGLSDVITYTIGGDSNIYRVINKAVEKGNKIIIYDYFIKINNDICYKTYNTNNKNDKCTTNYSKVKKVDFGFMKSNATKYKHTYQKNDDGNYYWVSSEPTSKIKETK